ncbi:MAG: hypothetical protein K8R11_06265 [Methanococcoides sp.]|nr:hypothetical protein [Methanococcoides sp.]
MQIKTILIVAMLCLAMSGIAIAPGTGDQDPADECCWAKPCGTLVEQCDQETTFVLYDVSDNAIIAVTADGYVYLDMEADFDNNQERVITPNDVRLTWWHTNYAPNTKVADDDYDNGAIIVDEYNDYMFTYMDINYNNKYDIYDPVYIDFEDQFNDQGTVSVGDIRLTDVPPVTPVKMVDAADPLQEGSIVDTSQYAGLDRWETVSPNDADMDADLELIGDNGAVTELVAWVDADDSGEWNCADKLYINQPNDGNELDHEFVTIGDVRLFIPEGDECVPACGTKVLQGDHDATYILNFVEELQLAKSVECNAVYVDMDNNNKVSYGDVRLSEVNKQINGETIHYEPNTKVVVCEEADLNDNLFAIHDGALKYLDIDGNPGYSLNDPVYLSFDDEDHDIVSEGDIRLTDSPVVKTGVLDAAYYGEAWSVVDATLGAEDGDVGMELSMLPGLMPQSGLEDVIGYIDSDCTGTWTCSDKLYVQQIVGYENDEPSEPGVAVTQNGFLFNAYDEFVTVGDLRLYIPQEAIDNEDWPACGTKVKMCDIDAEYALGIDVMHLISFADRDYNNVFSNDDAAYVDMDYSMTVTDGDVRLTSVTRKNTVYEPNTKVVCNSDMEDGDVGLQLEGHGVPWYSGIYTDLLSMLVNATSVKHFDTDCSGSWTCVDALYVQYNDGYDPITGQMSLVDNFVTHMDGRLYIPPNMICDDVPNNECEYNEFDSNTDGIITFNEVSAAIDAFVAGDIEFSVVSGLIDLFKLDGPYCE